MELEQMINQMDFLERTSKAAMKLQTQTKRSKDEDEELAKCLHKVCGFPSGLELAIQERKRNTPPDDPVFIYTGALYTIYENCRKRRDRPEENGTAFYLLDIVHEAASQALDRLLSYREE